MDFSGWFEVYLGGRWYTFDARHNVPRIGRVLLARGRDAADVAFATIFGPVVGSLVLVPLSEALRSNMIAEALFKTGLVSEQSGLGSFLKENLAHAHALIYGILVVIVILFMPDGVLGFIKKMLQKKTP